ACTAFLPCLVLEVPNQVCYVLVLGSLITESLIPYIEKRIDTISRQFDHDHLRGEDKTDLENSVMQKKIKIPKLSLNHVEEAGEVTDYGEEDVELRHSKVLKSFLFFFFLPFLSFFFPFLFFFLEVFGTYTDVIAQEFQACF
uniref:Uncharacterized protein n=1 Tax=Apteryx owenii TaxID=8824 RepID=A0A8B9PLF3_APTOW